MGLAGAVDHESFDEVLVPLAAPVLDRRCPDGPHVRPGARREAGHHVAAVAVELVDDHLGHEQLELAFVDQSTGRP